MIDLEGVAWRARKGDALGGIDLAIEPGEAAAIVGPSGAGKTHLAEIAAARARARKGTVVILGCRVRKLRGAALARLRRRIGYCPQSPVFFDDEPVWRNVGMTLLLDGASTSEVREAVERALEAVDLQDAASRRVRELSGGERKRAALARALVGEPALLVADDPLAGLDLDRATQLVSVLERAREDGAAVLVTSAEPRVASAARFLNWPVLALRDEQLVDAAPARSRTQTDPGDQAPENVLVFPAARAAGGGE
jgi:ABC-type ATPase involved in cell division